MDDADQSHALHRNIEVGEVDLTRARVEWEVPEVAPDVVCEHLPRDDVAVMLDLTEQDDISGPKVRTPPSMCDEIDRFRRP